jgi:hypothetical protein
VTTEAPAIGIQRARDRSRWPVRPEAARGAGSIALWPIGVFSLLIGCESIAIGGAGTVLAWASLSSC